MAGPHEADTGEPLDPDSVALARVLDGLGPAPDADPAARLAHERALADVDSIARAFGLIGETLGAEPATGSSATGSPGSSAASAADSSAEAPGRSAARKPAGTLGDRPARSALPGDDAVVLPLRRRRARWPVAAAASLVGVLALGVAVVEHDEGSGGSSSVAQQPAGPAHDLAEAPAPMYRTGPQEQSAAPGAAADSAAAPAAAAAAPAAAARASASAGSATSGASAKSAKTDTNFQPPNFDAAVACARGVLLARVVSVTSTGHGHYRLTLSVSEWITPGSGGSSVSYSIGSPDSADDSSQSKLTAGQRRVFIVPHSSSAEVLAYADSASLRSRIAQAQQQAAGQSCG